MVNNQLYSLLYNFADDHAQIGFYVLSPDISLMISFDTSHSCASAVTLQVP